MVLEKIFLFGQSQTRTVYDVYGNFVQAKRFQSRRHFRNWPTRNKNCLCEPFFGNGSGRNEQSL